MKGKRQKDQEFAQFKYRASEKSHPAVPLCRATQARAGDKNMHDEIGQNAQTRQAMQRIRITVQTIATAC